MENKINLVGLLRNCPRGMELDCTVFTGLEFDHIDENNGTYPIICRVKTEFGSYNIHTFNKYGCYSMAVYSKCVIFPKGKTTWEGFIPPCEFKDGDVITCTNSSCTFVAIFKKIMDEITFERYCLLILNNGTFKYKVDTSDFIEPRLATEEEKAKLFKAIKDNGYKWNAETKTLEKLTEFKAGDVLVSNYGNIVLCSHIDDKQVVHYHCLLRPFGDLMIKSDTGVGKSFQCTLATNNEKQKLFDKLKSAGYKYNPQTNKLEKLVEPKFKVGDKIRYKRGNRVKRRIVKINNREEFYYTDDGSRVYFMHQDEWELVPNKFDINTLVPFESKVLCRDNNTEKWKSNFWGFYDNDHAMNYPFECCGTSYGQCIPYEGNEHLLGKKDDCDEFYKTWK